MSLKTMPGFGKSGTSRIAAFSVSTCASTSHACSSLAHVEAARAPLRDRLAHDAGRPRRRPAPPAGGPRGRASASLAPSATTSTDPSGLVPREAGHPERLRLAAARSSGSPLPGRVRETTYRLPARAAPLPARETITGPRASPPAATQALDQAHWKLKPPIRPSTSSISPTRKSPGVRRDSIVRVSTSASGTPPAVASAKA